MNISESMLSAVKLFMQNQQQKKAAPLPIAEYTGLVSEPLDLEAKNIAFTVDGKTVKLSFSDIEQLEEEEARKNRIYFSTPNGFNSRGSGLEEEFRKIIQITRLHESYQVLKKVAQENLEVAHVGNFYLILQDRDGNKNELSRKKIKNLLPFLKNEIPEEFQLKQYLSTLDELQFSFPSEGLTYLNVRPNEGESFFKRLYESSDTISAVLSPERKIQYSEAARDLFNERFKVNLSCMQVGHISIGFKSGLLNVQDFANNKISDKAQDEITFISALENLNMPGNDILALSQKRCHDFRDHKQSTTMNVESTAPSI